MEISVSSNNIHINDSYKIKSKKDMLSIINKIRKTYQSDVLNRTDKSLLNEWGAHNLCYNLHLFRSHTADVDLDYPQKKYLSVCYDIIGFVYFLF